MNVPLHLRILPRRWQWGETVVLTVSAVGLAAWLHPDDPFLSAYPFPWVWVAPLLVALRYGMWAGMLSSGMILGGWLVTDQLLGSPFPTLEKSYAVGLLFVVLLTGEFGSQWNIHLTQIKEWNEYLRRRVHEITQSYYLLGMSHQQLEKHLASRPLTLRDALTRLRGFLLDSEEEISEIGAYKFLELVGQYFQFEVASIQSVGPEGIQPEPLAVIGDPPPLAFEDPLVKHALATEEFSHIVMADGSFLNATEYLIMAPAKRSDGTIISWLVVKQMRFLNLHRDNLLMLQAFLGYFADGVYSGQLSERILDRFDECPVPFARELTRLTRLQQELGLQSQLVLLRFDETPVQDQAVGMILKTARGLDEIWYVGGEVEQRLLVLLPFSDESVAEGYLERLRALLKERLGLTLLEAGVHVQYQGLEEPDPSVLVERLLEETAPRVSVAFAHRGE